MKERNLNRAWTYVASVTIVAGLVMVFVPVVVVTVVESVLQHCGISMVQDVLVVH